MDSSDNGEGPSDRARKSRLVNRDGGWLPPPFFFFSKRTGAIEMHLVCLVLVASGVTNGIVVSSSLD